MTNIEPGWYRDPAAPDTQRYWDGEEWIGKPVGLDEVPPERPEPLPAPAPPPAPEPARKSPPTPPPPGVRLSEAQVAELMAGRRPAEPGLRLVARLIDVVAVLLLNVVVNGWFVYQYVQEMMPVVRSILSDPTIDPADLVISDQATRLQWTIMAIGVLLWFLYEVPSTVSSGQTLGKRIMGIQVASIPFPKLRYGMVISRWSLLLLPVLCFPFGVILSIVDGVWCLHDRPFRQCLHDKSAMTMVIVKPTAPHVEGDADVATDPH
ncbi:uncharacterized protein DUF2510 [Stackebrandtia albiflava]|uniref:Uncharacterized protein DUF2510 n=1 Tax=Stackebrandtia albiflava TaxID=406432 RepID=A0A562V1D6_9ACTN|nr:RDD family protein [Stackebrandtia albiflava]TWJ11688.1 uncharacterized protein DUF2510 [Stackebrandtia albiflava]